MSDLTTSTSSHEWRNETIATAKQWYEQHQALKPLEKLKHVIQPTMEAREKGIVAPLGSLAIFTEGQDINVALPDPTVLLRGLDKLVTRVLASHPTHFRINLTRSEWSMRCQHSRGLTNMPSGRRGPRMPFPRRSRRSRKLRQVKEEEPAAVQILQHGGWLQEEKELPLSPRSHELREAMGANGVAA